jgi:hypothetical protein
MELIDKFGRQFRPDIHRINADGTPFVGRFGQFMPRGGRKPKPRPETAESQPNHAPQPSPAANVDQPEAPAAPEPTPTHEPVADFSDVQAVLNQPAGEPAKLANLELMADLSHEASAEAWLRGSYAVADGVFSSRGEWQPVDNSEHEGLKKTLVAWQKARNWAPLPPGGAFVMACVAFVWRRVREPNTAKTLVKWFPGLAPLLGVELPKTPEQKQDEKVKEITPLVATKPVSASAESFFQ